MQLLFDEKDEKEQQELWHKIVVLYKFDSSMIDLFMQLLVDWLRENHKFKDNIMFRDLFKIDYDNNVIYDVRNENLYVEMDKVNIDDKQLKKKIGFVKYNALKKFLETYQTRRLSSVKAKFDTFKVWARYGLLRVEYSRLKGRVAIIFYTKHKGIVKRMKDNIRKTKYLPNISIFMRGIGFDEILNELKEGILIEVKDVIVVS